MRAPAWEAPLVYLEKSIQAVAAAANLWALFRPLTSIEILWRAPQVAIELVSELAGQASYFSVIVHFG